ncbi:5-nitroimidazole antibiotic resistance protein [Synergistales bacterium]|nr:5-nitroimidazole antibiotic resistance protein [Synergistales bacterium]
MRQMREMRRKDKQVTDIKWMEDVLLSANFLHLGLSGNDGWPYVVPLCYGYKDMKLYFHGALEGMKRDILSLNQKACFQVTIDAEVIRGDAAQSFSMYFKSVTGFGVVKTLEDIDEKTEALNILMDQYDGPHIDLREIKMPVWAARLDIESMTGKAKVKQ